MDVAGNILRQQHAGPFRLIEKSYVGGSRLAMHRHATAYVSLVLRGGYREVSQQAERFCSSGTMIWHPIGEAHADHFHAEGGLVLDLQIDRAWLDDAGQESKFARRGQVCCGGRPYSLGLQLYRALAHGPDGIHDLGTELLGFFCSGAADRQPPAWFQRARQMVAVIADQRLSLTSVAREVGVHPVHLSRSFRRFTGCTFGEYLAQIRMRTAFDLLVIPDRSIAEVAHACGFADQAHFCRTFKTATGFTPSQFRQTSKAA